LIERRAEDTLIPSLKKNKVNLLTHHSLARGILTGKYLPDQPIPKDSRAAVSYRVSKWLLPEVLSFMSDLKEFADELKITCTALVIGLLSKNQNVQGILIGARNKKQLKEILDGISLDINEEIIEKVETLIHKNKLNDYKKRMPLWFQEK
jgi:aryl-alcohol dehydrogenase-like predicted oxidoreductase